MCLHLIKESKTKIAEEDLVFYKVLRIEESLELGNSPRYYTPYRGVKVIPGVTYIEKGGDFKTKNEYGCRRSGEPYIRNVMIEEEAFHLYEDIHDAIGYANFENNYYRTVCPYGYDYYSKEPVNVYYKVFKAVIPKGTKYIVGMFEQTKSVCAKAVRYEIY